MLVFLKHTLLVLMMGLVANPICCCTFAKANEKGQVKSCCHEQKDSDQDDEPKDCHCSEDHQISDGHSTFDFVAHDLVADLLPLGEFLRGEEFVLTPRLVVGEDLARPPDVPLRVLYGVYRL